MTQIDCGARGSAAEDVTRKLFSTVFEAKGPAYWR